jgi:putative CocE/NonD family hydrolase
MKALFIGLLGLLGCPLALAQHFEFHPAGTDDAALDNALPTLARQVAAAYSDPNQERYLANLFRLQMVTADYPAASLTIEKLRAVTAAQPTNNSTAIYMPDEIMASAMVRHAATGVPFASAANSAFQNEFGHLDDKGASDAMVWLWGPVARFHALAINIAAKSVASGSIELRDALDLVRFYQFYTEYTALLPLVDAWKKDDDARRYIIQSELQIPVADGATVCTLIVRQRGGAARRPTALNFTIYAQTGPDELDRARQAAARGYVGVVATTRGKACSTGPAVPWAVEGRDAYALIDWISKQSWSDGRVGMYGGSYEGFTQWAAAKLRHPALKTIVPVVANNPGFGLPMENNVFLYANYAWDFYATDNQYLDDQLYGDTDRWNRLNQNWYASGRPYREIDRVDGKPNPVLQEQLQHPSYDRYWQAMSPYREEFAHINIPVLSITGYFEDHLPTLQFFTDHYRYNRNAQHYLVIGPYDHFGAQAAQKPSVINGYTIDPVAQFDTTELTYEWFDYVLRHGPKPALLQDRVNYEVMGANVWRHAPSLEGMSNATLTLYLTSVRQGERYRLDASRPATAGYLEQTVDFTDRKTVNNLYPNAAAIQDSLDTQGALAFVSEPFAQPLSVSGRITASIKAIIDKRDMDLTLAVYEITPAGKFVNLSYYLGRASYADDISVRKLLSPGRVVSIPVQRTPMVSRQLQQGSRLLVLLTVNKNPFAQINYGTGKDVSDESISDATSPLHVRWLNDSFLSVPVWK